MAPDWKDALEALRKSGEIPIDNTPDNMEEPSPDTGPQRSPLHVLTDRKGRKGKTATIIEGFEGSDDQLEALAKSLKQRLGTGGSCRDGEILVQGDRLADVKTILTAMGYKVK